MSIFPASQLPATIAQTKTVEPSLDQTASTKSPPLKSSENLSEAPQISDVAKVSAQNQIVANADVQPLSPEQARAMSEREKLYTSITNLNARDKNGEKLDLRMPLVDEFPDRPLPGQLNTEP